MQEELEERKLEFENYHLKRQNEYYEEMLKLENKLKKLRYIPNDWENWDIEQFVFWVRNLFMNTEHLKGFVFQPYCFVPFVLQCFFFFFRFSFFFFVFFVFTIAISIHIHIQPTHCFLMHKNR